MKYLLLLAPLLLTQSTTSDTFEIRVLKHSRDPHQISITYRTGDGQRGSRTASTPFEMKVVGRSLDMNVRQVLGTGEFTVEVLVGEKYSGQGTARCEVHVEADRDGIEIRAGARVCELLRNVGAAHE